MKPLRPTEPPARFAIPWPEWAGDPPQGFFPEHLAVEREVWIGVVGQVFDDCIGATLFRYPSGVEAERIVYPREMEVPIRPGDRVVEWSYVDKDTRKTWVRVSPTRVSDEALEKIRRTLQGQP